MATIRWAERNAQGIPITSKVVITKSNGTEIVLKKEVIRFDNHEIEPGDCISVPNLVNNNFDIGKVIAFEYLDIDNPPENIIWEITKGPDQGKQNVLTPDDFDKINKVNCQSDQIGASRKHRKSRKNPKSRKNRKSRKTHRR